MKCEGGGTVHPFLCGGVPCGGVVGQRIVGVGGCGGGVAPVCGGSHHLQCSLQQRLMITIEIMSRTPLQPMKRCGDRNGKEGSV